MLTHVNSYTHVNHVNLYVNSSGKCHVESGNYPAALEALNSAIRINPSYAEVTPLFQNISEHPRISLLPLYNWTVSPSAPITNYHCILLQAYFQRGLVRIWVKSARPLLDLNRALAYNPNFFQAYLTRAAYFGTRGRYSKAMFNCNEALRWFSCLASDMRVLR